MVKYFLKLSFITCSPIIQVGNFVSRLTKFNRKNLEPDIPKIKLKQYLKIAVTQNLNFSCSKHLVHGR